MRTIRWGIIGCGDVTEVKSGPGFAKARNSALTAVMRRDATKAEDYARRHGVPRWTTDADAILRAPDIDAVYVATTPETHKDYVLRCAGAGKPVLVEKPMALDAAECDAMIAACAAAGKPVLVEKPMALDATECDAMIAACAVAGVPLRVAYYRRALPRFLKVRDLVADGAVGEVRLVVCRQSQPLRSATEAAPASPPWRLDAARSGGGYFVDVMSHTLDFLDFLLGPLHDVRALATNLAGAYDAEDTVAASWRFASGAVGSGAWCYAADRDEEFNEIVGTKGRLRFSTTRAVPILLERGDAREAFDVGDPPHVHQPLIQAFVDELNGQGACPSTGESAARTTRVIDAMLAEYRRRGSAPSRLAGTPAAGRLEWP